MTHSRRLDADERVDLLLETDPHDVASRLGRARLQHDPLYAPFLRKHLEPRLKAEARQDLGTRSRRLG